MQGNLPRDSFHSCLQHQLLAFLAVLAVPADDDDLSVVCLLFLQYLIHSYCAVSDAHELADCKRRLARQDWDFVSRHCGC